MKIGLGLYRESLTPDNFRFARLGQRYPHRCVIAGVPDTSFRREWLHFADCIHADAKPRTPLSGGLDLAVQIIQAMPPKRL
jgi:hypothetical protein